MSNNIIKDVSSFCNHRQSISGAIHFNNELTNPEMQVDGRINDSSFKIQYEFNGHTGIEGHFYLTGKWSATVELICSSCGQPMEEYLIGEYNKLRLIDEMDNSLNYEEECLETRIDQLDLDEWLLSELILAIPIAPRHQKKCREWAESGTSEKEQQSSRKLFQILAEGNND